MMMMMTMMMMMMRKIMIIRTMTAIYGDARSSRYK